MTSPLTVSLQGCVWLPACLLAVVIHIQISAWMCPICGWHPVPCLWIFGSHVRNPSTLTLSAIQDLTWDSPTLWTHKSCMSLALMYWRKQNDKEMALATDQHTSTTCACFPSSLLHLEPQAYPEGLCLTPPKLPFSSSHGQYWNSDTVAFVLLQQVTWLWEM